MGSNQRWLTGALAGGVIIDTIIVDAHHTVEYLKYAATRSLLMASGGEKANDQRLSPVSGIVLSVLGGGSNSLCTELTQETYDHAWSCLPLPD